MNANTFEAHGFVWTKHTPGDPMPCSPESRVYVICADGYRNMKCLPAESWIWGGEIGNGQEIIGWRFADAETTKPEPKTIREHSREEPWTDAFEYVRAEALGCSSDAIKAKGLAFLRELGARIYEDVAGYGYEIDFPSPKENDEMICADMPLSATDPGHLTPSQRRHIDAMEEKQSAKEKLQRDAESKALQERADSLNEAGRAMERVKQDHGHRLGYFS